MDSRHESLKEEFANHVIMTINTYIKNNTDTLVQDKILHDKLSTICKQIYSYLGIKVDTDNILSNHNLLSTDVVLFPSVADPEASKILNDNEFEKLMAGIKKVMNGNGTLSDHGLLKDQIINIVDECNAENAATSFSPHRF